MIEAKGSYFMWSTYQTCYSFIRW